MALKKYCIIALVTIMVMVLFVGSAIPVAGGDTGLLSGQIEETYIDCNNSTWSINRTFEYYIPNSYDGSEEVPLLFSFHGLGSNGLEQIDLTKFDVLAEQEGFIAVFPYATVLDPDDYPEAELPPLDGAEIQWNLGAGSLQYYAGVDDVGFVADMVAWFEGNYNIDTSRIYSTGMSDGALFSYLLAFNLTGTFAGIAPVCGPMPWGFGNPPTTSITVILMHGTADQILYYNGYGGMGGNVTYSVDETIAYWCGVDSINMTTPGPVETVWGPTGLDSTVVHRYVYSGGTNGTEVILFKVDGGGHTWPGGPLYSIYVGAVTTHIDGSAFIWKHLPPLKYYLTTRSTSGGSVTIPSQQTSFYEPSSTPIEVSLKATPASVYFEFVNWTWTLNEGGTLHEGSIGNANNAETTITITPDKDYEITANFQHITEEPPSGGCFIATAAYGTPTAKQLDVLRAFRDDVLLKSTVGSRLVDLYYKVSPPIADFISEHSFVRTLVRELVVDPIVWVVEATRAIW